MRATFFLGVILLSATARGENTLPPPAARGLKICVSATAPPAVRDAANQVLSAVATQPLLSVLSGTRPPGKLTDSEALINGAVDARAFDHLIVVGLPGDPIIQSAWQHEALASDQGMYIFGFGNLRGNVGYVESDRNPFLHSSAIKMTPYETEIITLTGSTPEGVRQAVAAFLAQGLINGVVAAPGWSRGEPTLLDRNPLAPGFAVPPVPRKTGRSTLIGVSAANESVYRGVLEAGGAKPSQIWQFKYYTPGTWDEAGSAHAITQYWTGLHRAAFDSTLWVAQFANATQASEALREIAATAHWEQKGTEWVGAPLTVNAGKASPSSHPLHVWLRDAAVYISTVPGLESAAGLNR